MEIYELIYICVFALLTVVLITLKLFRIGRRRRGVVKMITAALFVAAGFFGAAKNQSPYCWVLAAGITFASLGDLSLVFMEEKKVMFHVGVVFFSLAAGTMSVYSVLAYGFKWWSLLIFAALWGAGIFCQIKKVYSYGSSVVYLNVYTVLITLCGSFGLSVLCTASSAGMILFGLGAAMYMFSDVCLGLYLYKFRNRYLDAVNTLLYFPGLFLIALSLVFI